MCFLGCPRDKDSAWLRTRRFCCCETRGILSAKWQGNHIKIIANRWLSLAPHLQAVPPDSQKLVTVPTSPLLPTSPHFSTLHFSTSHFSFSTTHAPSPAGAKYAGSPPAPRAAPSGARAFCPVVRRSDEVSGAAPFRGSQSGVTTP